MEGAQLSPRACRVSPTPELSSFSPGLTSVGTRGAPNSPSPSLALSQAPGEPELLDCGSFSLSPSPLDACCRIPSPALSLAEKRREIFIPFAINSTNPSGCHQVPKPKVKRSLGGRHTSCTACAAAPSRAAPALQPWALPHPGASADAQMPVRNPLLPDWGGQGHGGLSGHRALLPEGTSCPN